MHYQELKSAWAELTGPGAPFEIETIEVRGAPMRVYKNAPPNARALWLSSLAFMDREYLVYGDERLTYGQAHEKVASVACWLVSQGNPRPATAWPSPCATGQNGCWCIGRASRWAWRRWA